MSLLRMLAVCLAFFAIWGSLVNCCSAMVQGTDASAISANDQFRQATGSIVLGSANDDQVESSGKNEDRINQLIQQLGSPSFAARQSAAEQLWQLGPSVAPHLERAAAQADAEVAKRAAEILSVLALGVDANTSPEVAKLVLKFNFSESTVRKTILEHLIRKDDLRLVYELLEQIKDVNDQASTFHEVMDFNDTLIRLARADRWQDIEFMLGHPITFEHERAVGVHFHLVNGTLPEILEELDRSLRSKEESGESVSVDQWLRVIAIYRMLRRFDEAESLAAKIREPEFKKQVLNQIMFEKGDWNQVAQRMIIPDDNLRPDEGNIVVTPAQAALVYQWIGDRKGYQRTVDQLSQKAKQHDQAQDREGLQRTRASLMEIGLANLDWPLVEANMDRENILQTFNLYLDHQRIDQAFEVVDFEGDVLQRDGWFNRKIEDIKVLADKVKSLKGKNEDTEEAAAELAGAWQLCLDVADQLGGLGLTDEAVLHYQTLFSAMVGEGNLQRRAGIIGRLIYLERYDEAWSLVEHGVEASEIRQVSRMFFPAHQQISNSYWNTILASRYPNHVERLKAVSGLLNSPMGTLPNFDLDFELASAKSSPTLNQTGYLDLQIASILEYHGRFEESRYHLDLSKQLGNDSAKRLLARRAFEQNDFATAAHYFDGAWRYRTSSFDSCLAAESNRQIGDFKKAALRQCVAYAYWRVSYRNAATIESLDFINQIRLIADFLKLDVYCIDGTGIANERFRYDLANAELESSPAASAIEKQLLLFNQAGGSEPGAQFLSYWGLSRKQTNVVMAKDRILKGQFKEAVDLLIQCDQFFPGDPGIAETTITELDKAGATAQADRLFDHLARFYVEILERYPDSPLHHNNYAWLGACAKRRTSHMLRHAQKAVAERPNNSSYLDTLATVYFQRGEKQKAIELCLRCIELNPDKKHYRDQLRLFESQ